MYCGNQIIILVCGDYCPAVNYFHFRYGPRRDTGSVESADSGLPPADPTDTAETTEPNSPHSYPLPSAFKYLRI